jgi:lipopolysaccharide export system protein LptA
MVLLYGMAALAAESPSSKAETPEGPTTITADRLEVSRKERQAVYSGSVVARRADFTIAADRMHFHFDQKMEAVQRMVAVGNVRISRIDGSRVTSERATYYVPEEKVVLEGNPEASQDGNMVSGTRITLYIKEDRQVVEGGGSEPVTAVIYPKGQPWQTR